MHKADRLLAIESIITEYNVSTQEELLRRLKGKGNNLYAGNSVA